MSSPRAPLALRIVGAGLALAFAFPGAYLVYRTFAGETSATSVIFTRRTLEPLWRTIRLATAVSLAAAVIGTSLAWVSTRTDLPLRRLWRVLLPIPLVVPTFVGAAAFIRALNPGGLASEWLSSLGVHDTPELRGFFGAWLVLTLFTYPYVYLPVAARLRQLPGSLEESARVLGDTPTQAFRRIVLRQIAGSILAGTLLVFLYTISDFGAVQLMRYDTLTRAIHSSFLTPAAFGLSLFLLALAAVVVVLERSVSKRLPEVGTVRSHRPTEYGLGRWRWPTFAGVTAFAVLAIGAPIAALLDMAGWLGRTSDRALTIDRAKVIEAAGNTLESSLVTAVVAILAVLPIAYLVGRFRDPVGDAGNAVIISTFALPGIVIALSLVFWTVRGPQVVFDLLNGSMPLLIFAYMVRFGSLAMGVTLVAVRAVPSRLHDAAASLGATRARRLRTIDLPLMAPGLLAGAGLVVLSTMKELPITLLVAPFDFPTLTTRIFQSFEDAFVREAGIMSLVLVAMSAVLSWFLVIRRADHL